MKTYITTYDTISSFLADCDKPTNATWKEARRSSRRTDNNAWCGSESYDAAKKLALYGWEAGLKKLASNVAVINNGGFKAVTVKAVAGSHPDVARFCAGLPDCMNNKVVNRAAQAPCVDIVLNCSYSGSIDAKHIMNYGAAIASYIDALETSGYSVSLAVGAACQTYDTEREQGCVVNLKSQGEALDLGKLAFFIAHPSFLRRLAFAQWEVFCDKDELASGYGKICDFPAGNRGQVYFGKALSLAPCATLAGAIAHVHGMIAAQMPELLEVA